MEAFVASAVEAGFTAYGVSSHAPLPFETRWTVKQERVPAYLEEIARLKKKYAGQIELYAGMEIDYLNEGQNPAIAYFRELPLDYRIGSVHLVYTPEGEIVDTDTNAENFRVLLDKHFGGDLKKIVGCYFAASMKMVEAGGFDFVGHADKISFNANQCEAGATDEAWYKKMREDFFALVAEKEVMLEVNTKAWQKRGCFFPDREYFARIREWKIPVVVNSDAHLPEMVNVGRPEALQALLEAGFQTVRELHGGRWTDVLLETKETKRDEKRQKETKETKGDKGDE